MSSSLPSSSGGLPPHNGDSSIRLSVEETNGMLKAGLYSFAATDEWHGAISIFDEHPDMVLTPLTDNGDTTLHIAVSANSINFVQHLVNVLHMTDLEIRNNDGNTAFCLAAISGNATLLRIMMGKNGNLPLIYRQDGMLPVHLAASSGHHEIVHILSSDNLLLEMKYNDIERLFLTTISSDIFDVAKKLFEGYRNLLALARSNDGKTIVLRILARKPSEFSSVDSARVKLFKEVWRHFRQLECNNMLEPMDKPSTVLFDTIKSGNDGAARLILDMNPELLTLKDSDGQSPLHYAALYGRERVARYILQQRTVNLIIRAVDSEGNNVLHSAASYQSHEKLSRLDIKLQRELAWFKEVEERLPPELRTMKNSKGQTPKDMFHANKRELSKEVMKITKEIAHSGMLVATLIATIAFAAVLTGPGKKTSAWFVVFILTNTVALFASSAYVISFLSIFASPWFTKKDFIFFSPTLIEFGLVLLFVAVVTMVMSFAAAIFLIFGHNHIFQWVPYVAV